MTSKLLAWLVHLYTAAGLVAAAGKARVLACAYGFSRTGAKTDDGFFLGFPSYWNVVAFYLYLLEPRVWVSLSVIVACSLLTFAPMRYLYLTRGGRFAKAMLATGAVWAVLT